MKKTPDYTGVWKGSCKLHIADDMSTLTRSLVNDFRNTLLNLIGCAAMDHSNAKNRHELFNMLSNLQKLHSFKVEYDVKTGILRVDVEATIQIYLPEKKKRKKSKKGRSKK